MAVDTPARGYALRSLLRYARLTNAAMNSGPQAVCAGHDFTVVRP